MGTSDLSKELNVTTRRALQTSLQLVVLAAKKYSKGKNYGEAVKVVVLGWSISECKRSCWI